MADLNQRASIDLSGSEELSYFHFAYIKNLVQSNADTGAACRHPHTEFVYVAKGEGSLQFDMGLCPVTAGDFVAINPHVAHTTVSSKTHPMECILLGVFGLEPLHKENSSSEYALYHTGSEESDCSHLLQMMLHEFESQKQSHQVICDFLLKAFLLRMLREEPFTGLIPTEATDDPGKCAAIRSYIDAHCSENITLDSLAVVCNMNKFYLSHLFKHAYGISPIHYLQMRRIAESKRLLTETSMTSAQISKELCYASSSHFSQCFKRWTKVTPSEYRRISREEHSIPCVPEKSLFD